MLRDNRGSLALASILLCSFSATALAADIGAAADSFVDGQATTRDSNFGAATTIRVRNSGPRIALVRFVNLPPAGNIVGPVELRLRVATVNVPGDLIIRRVNSQWFESTVTWNSRPTIDPQVWGRRTLTAADAGKVVSIDVTNLAVSWAGDPPHNFGLAIVGAPGSRAEVFFSARESGPGPLLRTQQAPSDNVATVGKAGEEYPNPVIAARNAFAGDTWCQAPTSAAPCLIRVSEGIFILQETLSLPPLVRLACAGQARTQLIARRGLPSAVVATGHMMFADIQDCTIVNSQPSIASAVAISVPHGGSVVLRRVGVHSAGTFATAIDSQFGQEGFSITDSDVSVDGRSQSFGISGPMREFALDSYANLSIVATGGNSTDTSGLGDAAFLGASADNITVIAIGGHSTTAAALIGSEDALTSISNSYFAALSDGLAHGLETDAGSGGMISASRVIARGRTSGTGMSVVTSGPPGPPIALGDVIVEGTTTGLQVAGEAPYTIHGAHVTSDGTAFRSELAPEGGGQSRLDNSFFEAPISVEFRDRSPARLMSDVLSGERLLSDMLACTEAYDQNYRLLDAICH